MNDESFTLDKRAHTHRVVVLIKREEEKKGFFRCIIMTYFLSTDLMQGRMKSTEKKTQQ